MSTFGPAHHALLFSHLARALLAFPEGEAMVRAAVRRYGEERGGRMAQRCLAAGQPLDMTHYLAYGEWRAARGAQEKRLLQLAPDVHLLVMRCPWQAAWAAEGALEMGRLYCQEVDLALVRGFNSQLVLEVRSLLTAGAEGCEFLFRGADLAQSVALPEGMVQPWEYHLAHLFATMRRVAVERLGLAAGAALDAALAQWGAYAGEDIAAAVAARRDEDFSVAR